MKIQITHNEANALIRYHQSMPPSKEGVARIAFLAQHAAYLNSRGGKLLASDPKETPRGLMCTKCMHQMRNCICVIPTVRQSSAADSHWSLL